MPKKQIHNLNNTSSFYDRYHHHHHHLPPWIRSLTCSGIDALPLFPGVSAISSLSRFVVEAVFQESGVVHSFEVVDPIMFVFESHILYSRDL